MPLIHSLALRACNRQAEACPTTSLPVWRLDDFHFGLVTILGSCDAEEIVAGNGKIDGSRLVHGLFSDLKLQFARFRQEGLVESFVAHQSQ